MDKKLKSTTTELKHLIQEVFDEFLEIYTFEVLSQKIKETHNTTVDISEINNYYNSLEND